MRFFLYGTGRKPAECNASRAIAIFVIATVLLNAIAPSLAHAATLLQGARVNTNTLVRDAYVHVTYSDRSGEQKVVKGWIYAVNETSFTIRSGGLKSKKTITYDKVVSVIMSDDSTVPAKQMNEVNRFVREMSKRWKNARQVKRALWTDAKVRIQALQRQTIGRLVKMTSDTLVIQSGRTFFQIPRASISRLEVSIRQRNTREGMLFGFVLGLGVLAPIAIADASAEENAWRGLATTITALYVSLPIYLLCTLIGAAIKSDKWVEVPPQSLNLSLAPLSAVTGTAQAGTSTKGLRATFTFNF